MSRAGRGRAAHRDTSTAKLESVACLILFPHMQRTVFFPFSPIPYLPPNDVIYKKQACQSYSHISLDSGLTFTKIDFCGRCYVTFFLFIRYEINAWSTRNAKNFQSFSILWISHTAQEQLQGWGPRMLYFIVCVASQSVLVFVSCVNSGTSLNFLLPLVSLGLITIVAFDILLTISTNYRLQVLLDTTCCSLCFCGNWWRWGLGLCSRTVSSTTVLRSHHLKAARFLSKLSLFFFRSWALTILPNSSMKPTAMWWGQERKEANFPLPLGPQTLKNALRILGW